jgi:hypothetical protein
MVWELEGLDDLNFNLRGLGGQSFDLNRMLHNSLGPRTSSVIN